jgi:hypothetical protein
MKDPAAAREPGSRGDAPGDPPEGDRREAYLAAIHELAERLTAITNYLASSLRLSQIGGPGAAMSLRHSEVLEKALDQANRADEVIHRLRQLLVTGSEMAGGRERAIREKAYALWEQDGHPHGRDLEHWLRAEAEISGDADVGVADDGKPVKPRLTKPLATRPGRASSTKPASHARPIRRG